MAAFRERFNEKVVAEMRGVIDEQGYSPFWESLGKRFFAMEFSRADYLCGTGQKLYCRLMPKHPLYIDFLSDEARGDRRSSSANRAGPRGAGERRVSLPQLYRHFRRRADAGVRH
jgi:arginine/ornithine succinyltransferase subunit-like protein